MTFEIWYKEHKVFDIELYLAVNNADKRTYYTTIKPYIIAEGISRYVFNEIKTEEQLSEFIRDTEEVDDMQRLLFEGYWIIPNWTNNSLTCSAADARLCRIHMPKFKEIMKAYCDKYGLEMSED